MTKSFIIEPNGMFYEWYKEASLNVDDCIRLLDVQKRTVRD